MTNPSACLLEQVADEELLLYLAGDEASLARATARVLCRHGEIPESCHALLEMLEKSGFERALAVGVAVEVGHSWSAVVMVLRFIQSVPPAEIDEMLRANGVALAQRSSVLTA